MDKNEEGDYLISGRHVETVYKISGTNGSIMWKLGGKSSDFVQSNLNFSYQHDVRYVSQNSTVTIISLFDNAYNGYNGSALHSEGKIISLDNTTMTASLLREYEAPGGGAVSASQGNMQLLPNGNVFLGWGSWQSVSESTSDGTPVYYAHFATTDALQYRSFKFNFTSRPTTSPALYTYAHNTSAQTDFYVSWNGATEVSSWRFYAGSSSESLKYIGNIRKTGFETVSTHASFFAFAVAEAIAKNGTELRNSTITKTFIPGNNIVAFCDQLQCPLSGGQKLNPIVVAMESTPLSFMSEPTRTVSAAAITSSQSVAGRKMLNWKMFVIPAACYLAFCFRCG